MAIAELVMPKLGESIMEATILKWHKQVGDFVKHDETVLDIATDKVDSEVPSTEQGILLEILYNVNDVVPIGTVIARIQTSVDAVAPAAPAPVVEPVVVPEPVAAPAPVSYQAPVEPAPVAAFVAPVPEPQVPYTPSAYELPDKPIGNRFYSPLVLNIANSEGISLSELERIPGTGNEGRVSKKDVLQYVADKKAGKIPVYQPAPVYQAPPPVYQQPVAPVAAPVYQEPVAAAPVYQEPVTPVAAPVEAIAPAAPVAPVAPVVPEPVAAPIAAAYKAPTVPQQITIPEPVAPAPVTAAPAPVAAAPIAPAPVAAPISVAAPQSTVPLSAPVASSGKFSNPASVTITGATEIQEMDRMRKLIAKHMVDSKHTSPHVTSFTEADVTNMVNWRSKVKDEFEKREGTKLTFTPMFIECIAEVIKKFPLVNCSIDGDNVIIRKDINIGMATALPSGNLIVPVIKGADQLNIVGLSKAVNGLADAARNTRLKPEDTQGGTFTLTNVGTFGSLMGTPIIPQPQVAILAVGAIKKRPMVMETPEGDIIAIRHMMYLSMSYDHRIVDGSIGASFLTAVAKAFENWDPNKQWFQYL
jgi:2-oxoglutarate dehydrogenase E2 component (dihydrolipoamide succinyltransferase)